MQYKELIVIIIQSRPTLASLLEIKTVPNTAVRYVLGSNLTDYLSAKPLTLVWLILGIKTFKTLLHEFMHAKKTFNTYYYNFLIYLSA